MPYCRDDRWHKTREEADACVHHPADKDFRNLTLAIPAAKKKSKPAVPDDHDEDEDEDNLLVPSPVATPNVRFESHFLRHTRSKQEYLPAYMTPPATQDQNNDNMGDNIQVASSSPAMAASRRQAKAPICDNRTSSSPAPDSPVINNDDDDIPGPLSSSPPPPASPSTSRVPETVFSNTNGAVPANQTTQQQDRIQHLENEILSLRASRSRLTDALNTAVFRADTLVTRNRINQVTTRLANLETQKARAEVRKTAETAEVAREARKEAWKSIWLVLLLMVMGYTVWCWYYSVEFTYVRARRCWVYGLGEGC